MRPVLVLRPEPGNAETCTAARALGLSAQAAPLFAYAPRPWTVPGGTTATSPSPSGLSQVCALERGLDRGQDERPWQGLLIGSAAVLAHGGPNLARLRAIPVHAVGPTTAGAAQSAGFRIAQTGSGGLQGLVGGLAPGRYLRLAGEARVALTPPPGVTIDEAIVYAAQPQPLDAAAIALIRHRPVLALLHSGEAARHFAAQCAAHDLPRARVALACLAPRIAEAAGVGWQSVACAPRPADNAVLSLALQMCQTL